jgi:PAS domain S-box-containing protein
MRVNRCGLWLLAGWILLLSGLVMGNTVLHAAPTVVSVPGSIPGQRPLRDVTAVVLRDFPPLYATGSNGQPVGFAVDVVRTVADRAGWSLRWLVVDTWEEAVAAVRDQRATLAPLMAITPQRERDFVFSYPVERLPLLCFAYEGPAIRRNESLGCNNLTGLRVVVAQQGAAWDAVRQYPGVRLIQARSIEMALQTLVRGQADLLVATAPIVVQKAAQLGLGDTVRAVGQPLLELKRAMLLHRDSAELVPEINTILQETLRAAEYETLYRRHYGSVEVSVWRGAMVGGGLFVAVLGGGFWMAWRRGVLSPAAGRHVTGGLERSAFHHPMAAHVVLAVATLVTVFGWYIADVSVERRANDRVDYAVEEARLAIAKRMRDYEQVLRGGVGMFNASDLVTREDWRRYVETLQIGIYWPGIQGVGFTRMFPVGNLEEHTAQIRSEGFPEYTVRRAPPHPGTPTDTYSAIIYLEPFTGRNLRAFGYDMFSEPIRHQAMAAARDTGNPTISGKVTLVQETSTDVQAGFLMYLPVYRQDMPLTTVEERRSALLGFVYSPFRIKDLMRGILGHGVPEMDFEIFDGVNLDPAQRLFASYDGLDRARHDEHAAVEHKPRWQVQRTIELPGRTWNVHFRSRPQFERDMESQQPLVVGVLGALVDLLLFVMVRSLSGQRERVLREAERISQTLHAVEARYQRMVEHIRDVIFQTDPHGRWSFLNPAWPSVSGYTVESALGEPMVDFLYPDDRERLERQMARVSRGELDAVREEVCMVHRQGHRVWLDLYASAMPGTEDAAAMPDRRLHIFGTLHDISERKAAEHAMTQARAAAESANRAKSEFLANMSHELRTPLNSMLILARLLTRETNLTPEQVDSARIIYESGTDLLRLINDILDLSKVEAGRMDVAVEPMAYTHFLHIIQRQFRPVALSRALTWAVELDPVLADGSLVTDWGKVEQIMRNLLSNALKFTEQGGVTLRINRVSGGVTMAVVDTGIGIPETYHELIFDTFRQVDGATSRRYGGTGLGLSIARRFAHLLGGEIRVASTVGAGSTFTLSLPDVVPGIEYVPDMSAPESAVEETTAAETAWPEEFCEMGVTVLVVDDEPRNRYAIGRILSGRVAAVRMAADGVEALRQLETYPEINLVLMDIMMPNMDGWQAMRAIRQRAVEGSPWLAHLPVIALTAKVMPGDRERCLEAGANAYLPKPLQIEQLFAVMRDLLSAPMVRATFGGTSGLAGSDRTDSGAAGEVDPPRPEPEPVATPVLPQLTRDGHPVTLLLVDDDMRSNFALVRILQTRIGKVWIATDGFKALQQLAAHPEIDGVLLDLMMPNMDGWQTLQTIRADERWQQLGVLVITSGDATELPARAMQAGADGWMVKPVEADALWAQLVRCRMCDPSGPAGLGEEVS